MLDSHVTIPHYDAWKALMPETRTVECSQCHDAITRGLKPDVFLRAVFAHLTDESLFCTDDCLREWIEEHAEDAMAHGETAHVEEGLAISDSW